MKNHRLLLVLMCLVLVAAVSGSLAWAVVFVDEQGKWPADWPAELEPLRATSRTIDVGTGLQEAIYEIPLVERKSFEAIWPAVRKLITPGATFTLYRKGPSSPKKWGHFVGNKQAAIRIYAPSGGYATKAAIDPINPPKMKPMVDEGRALLAGPPWPATIVGKQGELPEYVVAEADADGRLTWDAGDWRADPKPRGFLYRARVDVDLVVDGEVIDLNRVELPEGVRVVDRRFEKELGQ
jgi:hypothetical protein